MNKKLLTAAMAAAIAAPLATPSVVSADTTVYGRINNALVYRNVNDGLNDGVWDVESNASRFGFKGSEDLGNGMKALFQMEFAVDTANGLSTSGGVRNRLGWVGLSGGWGTAAIGRQWTPFYGAVNKTDIFQMAGQNNYTIMGTLKTVINADADDTNNIDNTTGRIGDAVAYVTPTFFGGFSAALAVVAASEADVPNLNSDDWDAANLALNYNRGGLSVGASAMAFNGDNDQKGYADFSHLDKTLYGVAAKYTFNKMFSIIGQYENYDSNASYAVAGEYYFGNNTLRAVYGYADPDKKFLGEKDFTSYGIELQHNFSKRTLMYVSYLDSDLMAVTDANQPNAKVRDGNKFGVGLRHDF